MRFAALVLVLLSSAPGLHAQPISPFLFTHNHLLARSDGGNRPGDQGNMNFDYLEFRLLN